MWWKTIQLRKLEKLGEGGQGEVYRALRLDPESGLNQIVALKILHSKKAVDLWRHEFNSLAKVRSHYCVRVLSFERHSGRPALVLEYVEGPTLARLAQSCCLEREDIEEVLAQIECGLSDLHRFGVIHGDLSPHNILVDGDGQIKLLDFGLANCSVEQPRMTPQFAAPERLVGAPPNEASDLYSLGCIEEFLTGQTVINSVYMVREGRRLRGLRSDPKRARDLGDKVRALHQRQSRIYSTQTQTGKDTGPRPRRRLAAFAAGLMLASAILFLPTASPNFPRSLPARLRIHTKHWHFFALNGRTLGFAPLTVLVDADEKHSLSWTSAGAKGARELQMHPGESIDLEDSDFSH